MSLIVCFNVTLGNKAYQQYYWEDVIGSVPNMGYKPPQTADYGATETPAVVPTMERGAEEKA